MKPSSDRTSLADAREHAARIPEATYRLQFNKAFTFRDARALVSYFHDLGVSDLHASPVFKTCHADSHGYDVCDQGQLNPEIGSAGDFEALARSLKSKHMGLILDMVPNHMGIGAANRWWMDVLENGPSSIYAAYFDIDWQPVTPELQNKILLPILEDQYGTVLESGKLRLAYENGAFFIYHYETKLPVAPRSYADILGQSLATLSETLGQDHEQVAELQSILTALSYLPARTELAPDKVAERNREKEVIKRRIAALYEATARVRKAIDEAVEACNGTPGEAQTFDLLDALLDAQAYRPAYWRVAGEEINYRRFFDINDLAAIRVESPEVFRATHELVLRWLVEGKVTGLRIDHVDGLWDASSYLRQIHESFVLERIKARPKERAPQGELDGAAEAPLEARRKEYPDQSSPWPLYVVAEKILSEGEPLPGDWAVHGTTGYDFLSAVNGLFVDGGNRRKLDRVYRSFTGNESNFPRVVNASKKMNMLTSLSGEINALSHQLERIAKQNRHYRDFTLNNLTFALREVIASLAVYRTYICGSDAVTQRDQKYVEAAVADAKKRNPRTAVAVFDFIRDTLLLRTMGGFREQDRDRLAAFVMKFQQITGPVMAKGVEDTAFYVYNRLVSLNEVGGNPGQFGVSLRAFHQQNTERQQRWPHSILATSTHDTKRSEDVRARISVLSEIPQEWRAALKRWRRLNAAKKTPVDGEPAPDPNDEYLFYQTLLGAWPFEPMDGQEFDRFRERIAAYMFKATKEAKVHTSWINANGEYDAAVRDFVLRVLADHQDLFLADFLTLQRRAAHFGRFNSLSQVLLKLTSPGVPELYQGTELWDFSLVDPDNRRPVDFKRRQMLLSDLRKRAEDANREPLARELLDATEDGRIKLYLTRETLTFRRAHASLFSLGDYSPLEARGEKRDHVCAFLRALGEEAIIVAAPRLFVGLTGGVERLPLGEEVWGDTRLALHHETVGRRYRDLFTGEMLPVERRPGSPCLPLAKVFAHFPVAILERAGRQ